MKITNLSDRLFQFYDTFDEHVKGLMKLYGEIVERNYLDGSAKRELTEKFSKRLHRIESEQLYLNDHIAGRKDESLN